MTQMERSLLVYLKLDDADQSARRNIIEYLYINGVQMRRQMSRADQLARRPVGADMRKPGGNREFNTIADHI